MIKILLYVLALTISVLLILAVMMIFERQYKKHKDNKILQTIAEFFCLAEESDKVESVQICSIDQNANSKHIFVLGISVYRNKSYYYVYRLTEDDGRQLERVNTSDVTIYTDLNANEQSYMQITTNGCDGTIKMIKMHLPDNMVIQEYHSC